jgi:hypothetical protein
MTLDKNILMQAVSPSVKELEQTSLFDSLYFGSER